LSTTIQIKRRVTGAPGAPASLAAAEIAFNEVDSTLYYGAGNSNGLATNIIPIAHIKPDAPNDGQMYGMVSGAWGRAVSVAGDIMSGGLTVGGLTVGGATNLKGNLAVAGNVIGNIGMTGNLTVGGSTGLNGNLAVSGSTTLQDLSVNGYLNGNLSMRGTYVEITGNLAVDTTITLSSPNAYKAGGGPWLSGSDRRIKNVRRKYVSGLAQIEQLQPIVYSYKGNDAIPGGASPHGSVAASGKELIGLVAQECEEIFPEMVTRRSGFVDGAAVPDLRELDTGPLLYAMLNAIKELSRRLRAAEAKLEGMA
jgi:cytoskeletal protein CcmA (bactofilin family)